MRQAFVPFGGYRMASRADFPTAGKHGYVYLAANEGRWYLYWENKYELYGGMSGGTADHDELENVHPYESDPTVALHVDGVKWQMIDDIQQARPLKPSNLSPTSDATEVKGAPIFESSPYANPYGGLMYGYQLEVLDANGGIVYDSGNIDTTSVQFKLHDGVLIESTSYTWRVRYQAGNLQWSDWSESTSFTTAGVFSNAIESPGILMPRNGTVVVSEYPVVVTTPFEASSGLIQADGNFEVAMNPTFEPTSIVDSGVGKNIFNGTVQLSRGQEYYARAKHKATTGEESAWSFPSRFTIRSHYRDTRVGLVLVDKDAFLFDIIGRDYSPVALDPGFFDWHPTWAIWKDSCNFDGAGVPQYTPIDGQSMMTIPAFYRLSGTVPSGPYAGCRMWMMDSTTPTADEYAAGWHVDDVFMYAGIERPEVYISSCLTKNASGVAVSDLSSSGTVGANWTNRSQYLAAVTARNSDASDPLKRNWAPFTFRHYYMMLLLAMIEYRQTQYVVDRAFVPSLPWKRPNTKWGQLFTRGNPGGGYGGFMLFGLNNGSMLQPGEDSVYVDLPSQMVTYDSIVLTYGQKLNKLYDSSYGAPELLHVDDGFLPYRGNGEPNVSYFDSVTRTPNSLLNIYNYGSYQSFAPNGILDLDLCTGLPFTPGTSAASVPSLFGAVTPATSAPGGAYQKQNLMAKYN